MFLEAYVKHVSHRLRYVASYQGQKYSFANFPSIFSSHLTPVQGIILSQPQKIKLNLLSQAPFFQFLRILTTLEILEFFLCWVRVQILSSFLSKLGWTICFNKCILSSRLSQFLFLVIMVVSSANAKTLFLGSPIFNVVDVVSLMNRRGPNVDPFRTLFMINFLSD